MNLIKSPREEQELNISEVEFFQRTQQDYDGLVNKIKEKLRDLQQQIKETVIFYEE